MGSAHISHAPPRGTRHPLDCDIQKTRPLALLLTPPRPPRTTLDAPATLLILLGLEILLHLGSVLLLVSFHTRAAVIAVAPKAAGRCCTAFPAIVAVAIAGPSAISVESARVRAQDRRRRCWRRRR